VRTINRDQGARLAVVMQVSADDTVLGLEPSDSLEAHRFTGLARHRLYDLGDGLPLERLSVDRAARVHAEGRVRRCVLAKFLGEPDEIGGAGHEVGLAVKLDHRRGLPVRRGIDHDQPLRGGPLGPSLGFRDALLAQDFGGLVHVALRFLEGLLAIHHARAGPGAKLGYILR
jgi:hypothetical protein